MANNDDHFCIFPSSIIQSSIKREKRKEKPTIDNEYPRPKKTHSNHPRMASFQRFLQATTATLPRQCASAGILFATGDCIAQQIVEKKGSKHDIIRTARLTAYGGLIFSPIAAFWLGKVLERVPYKGITGTVTKVALDQSIAAPSLLALFFTSTTLMEGKSLDDVKVKLQKVSYVYMRSDSE